MSLNWQKIGYFPWLLNQGASANSALEMMLEDLNSDKPHTIEAFLTHFGSEDFISALVRMLTSENCRVAGNSAYILGTMAEHGHGQMRVMSLINGEDIHTILADLTTMLQFDDTECVMNAAGTLGTLAESQTGREWMLRETCIDITITRVTMLLNSVNIWTASNAALFLARLSISKEGSQYLLEHHHANLIITNLINSLGMDEAGRGTNAAFAIGRLCDLDDGRKQLLHHKDCNMMIGSLCSMLSSKDLGCSKSACYALSCLAGSDEGHEHLLNHIHSELMLMRLGEHLSNDESETRWFAAMTLHTLASKRKGCLRLRDYPGVIKPLNDIHLTQHLHQELKEEVDLTLSLLKRLEKPTPPRLKVKGPQDLLVEWDPPDLKNGLDAMYILVLGEQNIYEGKETSFLVTNLKPNMTYQFMIQVSTECDDSPFSEFATATTEESVPDIPEALRALQITTSQIKLGWSPPESDNGSVRCYCVYKGKQQVQSNSELTCIVSGLAPSTTYDLYVCACNNKGKGPKAKLTITTTDLGKHAPAKPSLTMRGRSQIHVTWTYPEFPLGRFRRFDLTQNRKVIYSGTDLMFTASRLNKNSEYTFTVIAVTSEGKCESEPAKKKTPKAEYKVRSTAPIFFSHPTKSLEQDTPDKAKDNSAESIHNCSKRRISLPNNKIQHGVVNRKLSMSSSSSDSGQDRWTDAAYSKDYIITLRNKTRTRSNTTSALSHENTFTHNCQLRRTKSDTGVVTGKKSDDEKSMPFPNNMSCAPVIGCEDVKNHTINGGVSVNRSAGVDNIDMNSCLHAQVVKSSQRLTKNLKDGIVESRYSNQARNRTRNKQQLLAKSHSKFLPLVSDCNTPNRIMSSVYEDTLLQSGKTTKQHTSEDFISQQLQRSIATYHDPDLELSVYNPSENYITVTPEHLKINKKVNDKLKPMVFNHLEFCQFTHGLNGLSRHTKTRPRATSGNKKFYLSSEFNNGEDHRKKMTCQCFAKCSYRKETSPRRQEPYNQYDSSLATDTRWNSGNLSMSSDTSWLTQAKLIPSFKKNIARTTIYPQSTVEASQSMGSSSFKPDLLYCKSKRFVPVQFKTQSMNLSAAMLQKVDK